MRIAAALLTGGIVGWLACQVCVRTYLRTLRRHDQMSDELRALRRLYDGDRNPSMGPQ